MTLTCGSGVVSDREWRQEENLRRRCDETSSVAGVVIPLHAQVRAKTTLLPPGTITTFMIVGKPAGAFWE